MPSKLRPALCLSLLLSLLAGCKSPLPDLSQKLPWIGDDKDKEPPYQQPVKMVVIWSPAMYNQPGQTPTRGFGGRIYFYNAKEDAVPVDGGLVIYAFDDTSKQHAREVPDKRFAFTAEQLKKHFSPTQLGASYSIWVPWDPVGNPQADISLLPVFTGTSGGVVTGTQSRNLLPGPQTPKTQTRFEQSIDSPLKSPGQEAEQRGSMITHTIGLPEMTATRLAASTATTPGDLEPQQPSATVQPRPESAQQSSVARFSAPTKESRSWGPVVPRRSIRPLPGPLARSAPSRPPAPAWRDLPPTAGLPQTPPLPAGQPPLLPPGPQSDPRSTGQVIYRDVSETAP
jgi:hypothetical protein